MIAASSPYHAVAGYAIHNNPAPGWASSNYKDLIGILRLPHFPIRILSIIVSPLPHADAFIARIFVFVLAFS
jgi:hypothetical protein